MLEDIPLAEESTRYIVHSGLSMDQVKQRGKALWAAQ